MADYVGASSAASQQEYLSNSYQSPTLDDSYALYDHIYTDLDQDHDLTTSVRISGAELSR
jgi:hypothetical protein